MSAEGVGEVASVAGVGTCSDVNDFVSAGCACLSDGSIGGSCQ